MRSRRVGPGRASAGVTTAGPGGSVPRADDEANLLELVLKGDEAAFSTLVRRYHGAVVRIARCYVQGEARAEDVAQDTWIAVIRGLERFEGRSSFKTWLFAIAANRARAAGVRDLRTLPVDPTDASPSVDPARFNTGGMWADPPAPFTDRVEDAAGDASLVAAVRSAITQLPDPQRTVVTLRDVEGLSTDEVGEVLGLSSGNVRVILHRGRAKVRATVEADVRASGR